MNTPQHLLPRNLIAVATVTQQTGFDSSHTFRHLREITEETTVGDLVTWVNGKGHILNLVSLEIQNTEPTE